MKRFKAGMKAVGRGVLTGLKVLSRVVFLLPIPLFMVWFSFNVDVSALFKGEVDQYNRDVAEAMINGQAIDSYDRMNERAVLGELAEIIEQPYDTISIGSSRILQLRSAVVGKGTFMNCGVSMGDFVDMLGLYYLFDRADKLPQNVILSIDPWIFDANAFDTNPRSDVALYNEFLSVCLGRETSYEAQPVTADRYLALLTPSYFQGNLREYRTNLENGGAPVAEYTPPAVVTGDIYAQSENIKLSDGSVLYGVAFRTAPEEAVNERAYLEHANAFTWMEPGATINKGLAALFEDYIAYLQSRGVNVIFYLQPYNPYTYEYAAEYRDEWGLLFDVEDYINSLAVERNIPVYGCYNPYVAGCFLEDYYDGLHLKDDKIGDILPTMEEILRAQKAGRAGSPWVTGQAVVRYEIAAQIAAWKYPMNEPEVLVRMDDETLLEQPCYVIGRYSAADDGVYPPPVLLARYAVSKVDGTVYRFDTAQGNWVYDARYPTG